MSTASLAQSETIVKPEHLTFFPSRAKDADEYRALLSLNARAVRYRIRETQVYCPDIPGPVVKTAYWAEDAPSGLRLSPAMIEPTPQVVHEWMAANYDAVAEVK